MWRWRERRRSPWWWRCWREERERKWDRDEDAERRGGNEDDMWDPCGSHYFLLLYVKGEEGSSDDDMWGPRGFHLFIIFL
jgi:hypothetical protein